MFYGEPEDGGFFLCYCFSYLFVCFHVTVTIPDTLKHELTLNLQRDDLSGMQLSGNKVRKLEFLLADAVAQGADCIVTIGGIQSNHCRATAVAAKYLNLDCYLILRTSKVYRNCSLGILFTPKDFLFLVFRGGYRGCPTDFRFYKILISFCVASFFLSFEPAVSLF